MEQKTVSELFSLMDNRMSVQDYNFEHFTRDVLVNEIKGSIKPSALKAGHIAPDFDLEDTEGKHFLLSKLKGKPVLLHFSSLTCPVTVGSLAPLKLLHTLWGEKVQFLDILIRQAHPGDAFPSYSTYEQKMADAKKYKEAEMIPWPVLCDDLEGRTHQVYSALSDPAFLIDKYGRIAFINGFTHVPTLNQAIKKLMDQDGVCVVNNGVDKFPHILAALVNGWPAIERGLPKSAIDLDIAVPGLSNKLKLFYSFKPKLDSIALRTDPFPPAVKIGAASFAIFLLLRLMHPKAYEERIIQIPAEKNATVKNKKDFKTESKKCLWK
jgi:hypothetical protein